MIKVLIKTNDKRWDKIKLDYEKIIRAALGDQGAEVSVLLTNDVEIQKLNKQYRGRDKPTNVLSFETGDAEILGDIVLSFDTISAESNRDEFESHATHMLIHGALHLIGMDHINDADAVKMESKETEILKKLNRKRKWLRALGFFALGAAATLGFAPYYLWPITIIALGAAYRMARPRDGFFFGAGYAIFGLSWMIESFFVDATAAATFGFLAPLAFIGIGLAGGIIFGMPFMLTSITRDTSWRRPFYFAAACTFVLWLRSWLFGGFPWNPLSGIFADFGGIGNIVGIIGVFGLSFIIAGLTAGIFCNARKKYIPISFFAGALVILGILSVARIATYNIKNKMPADFPTLRIVQPAIPQAYKSDRARSDENFEIVMELSKAPGKFDAIIWPESAYPWLVKNDTNFDLSAPLIFGGIRKENGKYYNSMFIHQNGRISAVYDKRHLVPFGEYSPLGKLVPVPGEFGFGNPKQGNMEIGKIIFSPSICYEIIFPNAFGADNSDMVINITNDGWFGKSIGPHQHLMMARLRAMESGLPVVRANYSGVSAIINPLGEVLNKLDLMERGIMDVKIPNKTSVGFFAQNQGILVILILSLAAALRLTNRRGSRKKG